MWVEDVRRRVWKIEELRFADRTVSFGGRARRSAGTLDGNGLLGRAETAHQKQLAERAPALAEAARETEAVLVITGVRSGAGRR